VCIGGDRATGYEFSKRQFLRLLNDRNPVPELDALEQDILKRRTNWASARWGLRQDHVAGCEDLRGESFAGVIFCQRQLHVLGLSSAGRDAEREGRD